MLSNQRRGYKCFAYTELGDEQPTLINKNLRYKYDEIGASQSQDYIELSKSLQKTILQQPDTIHLSISQDEFCRNIDNIIDDQYSFTFSKGILKLFSKSYFINLFFLKFSFNSKILQPRT